MKSKISLFLAAALLLTACGPATPPPAVKLEISNTAAAGLGTTALKAVGAASSLWPTTRIATGFVAKGSIGGNEFSFQTAANIGPGASTALVEMPPLVITGPATIPAVPETPTEVTVANVVTRVETVDPCSGLKCDPSGHGHVVYVLIDDDGQVVFQELRDDDGDGLVESHIETYSTNASTIVTVTNGWRQKNGEAWTPFIAVVYVTDDNQVESLEINTRHLFGR